MVKILHTGDLHLDSPFSGLTLTASERARDALCETFKKMMDYAKENAFDMVLISGDLFDGKYITQKTKKTVVDTLSSLECPVIIAPGNHDPYSAISLYRSGELPENVYVFSSDEMQVFHFDELGVSVCGYAFIYDRLDTSPLLRFTPPATNNALILCAHADTASPISKYAPTSPKNIELCGFSYAALGHIHNAPEIECTETLIRYCGFPMGRSFDETGFGGALEVTIDDEGVASAERIIFSDHRFLEETLDVSGAESSYDIVSKIINFINEKGYGEETSLRITLCGTVSLDCVVEEVRISEIPSSLSLLKVKNNTLPLPDPRFLEDDITLRGELYRTLLPKLNSENPSVRRQAAEALRLGLFAIEKRNIFDIITTD